MPDEVHSATRSFAEDAAEIFALLRDPHEHLAWLPSSEHVRYECHYEAGPPRGVGATYRLLTFRRGRRRPQQGVVRITAFDPPRRVEFTGEASMSTAFELEPTPGGGTRVTARRIYRGAAASRALNRVVKHETIVASLERDLERIAKALQGQDQEISAS